jgi:hypothetical protein
MGKRLAGVGGMDGGGWFKMRCFPGGFPAKINYQRDFTRIGAILIIRGNLPIASIAEVQ